MLRRHFLRTSALALGAAPLTSLFSKQFNALLAPQITMIRDNVGFYTNRGGSIGLYLPAGKPEGGAVIDTQFPEQATTLLEMLRDQGQLTQLSLLANTHHHGDHTGGNGVFADLAKDYVSHARAQKNLADNLKKNDREGSMPLPKTTFTTDWSMALPDGKERVTMKHFGPAHTGGDAVIHFEQANVAHLGDLLFNRRFPYIDPGAGGDIINWASVMKKIRKHYDRDTVFIFGHAAESYAVTGTSEDLKAFENYLNYLRKYVKKAKKAGTSIEALQAKTTTIPGAPEWRFGERMRNVNLQVMYEAL
ncbi:MBL fold metallo-hydrolase [Lewinella sp. W8]|nr:MBL fold metallo-hydrolase [Lewinella sp. W8]